LKKWLIPAVLAVAVASSSLAFLPKESVAASAELKKVEAQIQKLKDEMKRAEQSQKEAEKELQRVLSFKEMGLQEIARLEDEISVTKQKIDSLNEQMYEVEENLQLTVKELEDAQERVITRDALLKSRLRLMYMNGVVSYLDVLLSSTSFMDFLDRIDALGAILSQDKEILTQNILDKQTVERKKTDVEAQLDYVETLVAQTSTLHSELQAKKDKKEVAIASLEAQEHELEEMSAEDEAKLMKLADEQAALLKKQKELKAEEERKKQQQKKIVKYTGGQLKWPVPDSDRVTSEFGTRTHPITKKKHTHSGLDIGAPGGTTIVAAASGEVVLAQWYGGYGNCIIIEHKDGFRTLYGHIRTGGIKVKVGDMVNAGDKIAEVGSTGSSTGNHLHFSVYVNNEAVDPVPYLKGK